MYSPKDSETAKPVGVRALAKQRTSSDIVAASLRLFQTHGFDAVTTEQIAREAGVTQRTLFRYFARKDLILLGGGYDYVARFERLLDESILIWPSPYDAVKSAFQSLAAYFDANRATISTIYVIIQQSDQLKPFTRELQTRIDQLVAYALDGREAYFQRREPPSLQARIVAAVLFGTIRPMFRAWLKGELRGELRPYAEVGWANVGPLFNAAQAYAAIATEGFVAVDAARSGRSKQQRPLTK